MGTTWVLFWVSFGYHSTFWVPLGYHFGYHYDDFSYRQNRFFSKSVSTKCRFYHVLQFCNLKCLKRVKKSLLHLSSTRVISQCWPYLDIGYFGMSYREEFLQNILSKSSHHSDHFSYLSFFLKMDISWDTSKWKLTLKLDFGLNLS